MENQGACSQSLIALEGTKPALLLSLSNQHARVATSTCVIGRSSNGYRSIPTLNIRSGAFGLGLSAFSQFEFFPYLLLLPDLSLIFPAYTCHCCKATMENRGREASASPRGEHGTGTEGCPVVCFSRLVEVDREFCPSDHPLEQMNPTGSKNRNSSEHGLFPASHTAYKTKTGLCNASHGL